MDVIYFVSDIKFPNAQQNFMLVLLSSIFHTFSVNSQNTFLSADFVCNECLVLIQTTLTSVKMRVMSVLKNVQILTDPTTARVEQGTKKSIRLNARTLMNVKRRVMTVIRNVQILTDLTNAGVDQGTKKSIRLNAWTLMNVRTAFMTVNRSVRTPSALSCVLVMRLSDLDQTANTVWIILSVFLIMITRVMSHT